LGLAHATNAPESKLHPNVPLPFVEVNVKTALVLLVMLAGPDVMIVSGAFELDE
jgi:hypothetical protein